MQARDYYLNKPHCVFSLIVQYVGAAGMPAPQWGSCGLSWNNILCKVSFLLSALVSGEKESL